MAEFDLASGIAMRRWAKDLKISAPLMVRDAKWNEIIENDRVRFIATVQLTTLCGDGQVTMEADEEAAKVIRRHEIYDARLRAKTDFLRQLTAL